MRVVMVFLSMIMALPVYSQSFLDNKNMVIDNNAAVYKDRKFGIGTTAPEGNLHAVGATYVSGNLKLGNTPSASRLIFSDTTNGAWVITEEVGYLGAAPGTLGILRYDPANDRVFVTASVFLSPTGNLGLGMPDPLEPLGIGGGAYLFPFEKGLDWHNDPGGGSGDDAYIHFYRDGGANDYELRFVTNNDGDDDITFMQAGAARLVVTNAGVQVVGGNIETLSSDKRLKKNVQPIREALDSVHRLRGVTFYWKDDAPHARQIGVIAQEVQSVLPHQVHMDNQGMLSVAYEELAGVLVEAIKERELQIRALEKRLEALK